MYKGVLYAGLMLTKQGVKVLEFNARFGDPETQAVLMRLQSDLVEIMLAVIDERLHEHELVWTEDAAVCVVMASGGYPGSYAKGQPISGLEQAAELADTVVFHAGTKFSAQQVVSDGGRVLGVTACAPSIKEAIDKAYAAVDLISWPDCFCRRDIGAKALR